MRPSNPFLKVTLGVVLTAGSAPAALAKGVAPGFDLTNPAGASLQSPSSRGAGCNLPGLRRPVDDRSRRRGATVRDADRRAPARGSLLHPVIRILGGSHDR